MTITVSDFCGFKIDVFPPPNQLRNNMNQEQNSKLQQQRDNLNKKNQEVVAMDKRVNELRDRLWKKKAALQQKENLPVSTNMITLLLHRQNNNWAKIKVTIISAVRLRALSVTHTATNCSR